MASMAVGEFIPTDEANLAYFHIIKNAFNKRNAGGIYNLFSEAAQLSITLEKFSQQINDIYERQGSIHHWTYSTQTPDRPSVLLGFQKNLGTGTLFWKYIGSELNTFSMNDHPNPSFVNWMKDGANKFALSAIADNKILIDYNGNRMQDLMSTFKITVGIEYSRQSSSGFINGEEWINLDEVNKFYILDIDISHTTFLKLWTEQGKIQDNKVKLIEIARGMIALSSNACTEYLQTLLTLNNIKETVQSMALQQTEMYYLSSFLLVFLNNENLPREDYIKQIKSLTIEQIVDQSQNIHNELLLQTEKAKQWLSRGKELLDGEILGIQSQYFTKSTTNQYSKMLNTLNNGQQFSPEFYQVLYPLLGYVSLQNPALLKDYLHVGIKAGSSAYLGDTACVLSVGYFQQLYKAFPYKSTSISLFIEQLNYETEYQFIIQQFNEFVALTSLNGHYLNAVAAALAQEQITDLI